MGSVKSIQLVCLIIVCSFQSVFSITTQLSCLYNPKTGRKVALIYDHHYEYYCKVKSKQLKNIIKRQCNELANMVTRLSKRNTLTIFVGENCWWGFDYIKKYKRQSITIFAVAQFFRKQLHTCTRNFIFLPYDRRSWIDEFVGRYIEYYFTDHSWCNNCLFESNYYRLEFNRDRNKFKERLEEDFKDKKYFHTFTLHHYLDYINCCYRRMKKGVHALKAHSVVKETVLQRIEGSYSSIFTAFTEWAGNNRHKMGHSFHSAAFSEIALKNNIDLLVDMWVFSFSHFDIDLLHYIESTGLQTMIIQCGSMHAQFLEHVLLQIGYELSVAYGDEPTRDKIGGKNGKTVYVWPGVTEGEYLDSHLPVDLDQKIVDFFEA